MKIVLVAASALLAMAAGEASVILYPEMKEVVAPQAQILWDVGNRGMDDNGNPDGSKLSAADWGKISTAAQAMQAAAGRLATAPRVLVKAPGAKIQDEGAPGSSTPSQIQKWIDADPKAFVGHAQKLAGVADDFLRAAKEKDAAKLAGASGRLDEVCEACHMQFWYPPQGEAK